LENSLFLFFGARDFPALWPWTDKEDCSFGRMMVNGVMVVNDVKFIFKFIFMARRDKWIW